LEKAVYEPERIKRRQRPFVGWSRRRLRDFQIFEGNVLERLLLWTGKAERQEPVPRFFPPRLEALFGIEKRLENSL